MTRRTYRGVRVEVSFDGDLTKPSDSRFTSTGVLAGFVSYRDARSGRAFDHTVIATKYQGRGLASHLVRFALDEARATGRIVLPFCPFVRSFIQRHPAYVDLVGQPERFDLTLHTLDAW
jgi:uncharacterized protein